jgi:hypothetical protein
MDIVLDSNIYHSDILLRSPDYNALLDYLVRTESSLILPQIILDEIKNLYKNTQTEKLSKYRNAVDNLNQTFCDNEKQIENIRIDIDAELVKYESFLKSKLNIKPEDILPYENSFLPEISQRAINRHRPAGKSGQGFRDTLIWLTIKKHCSKTPEKQITFISNNTSDFADDKTKELYPTLLDECKELKVQINYFTSIREFLEAHSKVIAFVNIDWIIKNFKESTINAVLSEEVLKFPDKIKKAILSKTRLDTTDKFSISSVRLDKFDSFSVYEMLDRGLIVSVKTVFHIKVEFEFYNGPHPVQISETEFEDAYSVDKSNIELQVDTSVLALVKDQKITKHATSDLVIK